jgi:hypothetical protein
MSEAYWSRQAPNNDWTGISVKAQNGIVALTAAGYESEAEYDFCEGHAAASHRASTPVSQNPSIHVLHFSRTKGVIMLSAQT